MNSTSSFKNILKVDKLNIAFSIDFYRNGSSSLKDFFVSAIKSPINYIFKKRDYLHVLKDIDLELSEGDRLGIVGVNGAGKTTLCRCIAGMLIPDTGKVKIQGEVRSIFNSNIGVIDELTGRENAHLLAKMLFPKLSKKELQELVEDSMDFSELHEFSDVPFKNYSKGMQTRLCLSVISARPADLLILDEVLDGADQFFREKVTERMNSMISKSGAVIFVSHNPDQLEMVCNRLLVMKDHKVIFDGGVKKGLALYKFMGTES